MEAARDEIRVVEFLLFVWVVVVLVDEMLENFLQLRVSLDECEGAVPDEVLEGVYFRGWDRVAVQVADIDLIDGILEEIEEEVDLFLVARVARQQLVQVALGYVPGERAEVTDVDREDENYPVVLVVLVQVRGVREEVAD